MRESVLISQMNIITFINVINYIIEQLYKKQKKSDVQEVKKTYYNLTY